MELTHTLARFVLVTMTSSMLGLAAVAQESEQKVAAKDVPVAVVNAFKAAYPHATIHGYAKEKENGKTYYEIESREGTVSRDVLYEPDGKLAEVEETIAESELPAAALAAFHKQYPKAVITKIERTTAGEKVTYEVSAKRGQKRFSMEFDSNGNALKSK